MLKKKYLTTPLVPDAERVPLKEVPVQKPTIFRIVGIGWSICLLVNFALRARIRRRANPLEMAHRIRQLFEMLGGMWIKLGQVLSMRNDLFSPEFCNELLQLQDQAFAFPSHISRQMVEDSLGCPVEAVFDHFEEKPFAAASLSQVHKAFLREQSVWVAVKVQRPYALEIFRHDFWWLSLTFNALELMHVAEHFHWKEMLKEIKGFMEEELDYRHEASEMKKMRKILRAHKIYVPKVFTNYASRTVLVSEFLPAVFMSDFVKMARKDPQRVAAWLDENELEPKKIARRLLQSLMRQMFEDYSFHGDLHPGNILLLRKNRLALIDFGNTGSFDKDFISRYDQYTRAMASGNLSTAADMFLLFAGSIPIVDTTEVKKEVVRALQEAQRKSNIPNLPFQEKSLAATSAEINALVLKYKFDMNWNLLKMGRTFAAVDQTIGVLNPHIDYVKETRRYYIKSAQRRKGSTMQVFSQLIQKVSDLSNVVMPLIASRAIQFKGTLTYGTRAMAFILKMVSLTLGLGVLIGLWGYFYQHHSGVVMSYHDNHQNKFTDFIEHIPHVSMLLVIVLGVAVFNLARFVQTIKKKPVRLPGSSVSSH